MVWERWQVQLCKPCWSLDFEGSGEPMLSCKWRVVQLGVLSRLQGAGRVEREAVPSWPGTSRWEGLWRALRRGYRGVCGRGWVIDTGWSS